MKLLQNLKKQYSGHRWFFFIDDDRFKDGKQMIASVFAYDKRDEIAQLFYDAPAMRAALDKINKIASKGLARGNEVWVDEELAAIKKLTE